LSVSILIPAFRPTFLRQAIASALAQALDDFELVISDDSGGEEILPVVEQFRDPRIRYLRTAGRTGSIANCAGLWEAAKFERLAYLLDDDLLMPQGLAELLAAAEARPDASFWFGHRIIVDAGGRVISEPQFLKAEMAVLDAATLTGASVAQVRNPIGEFSNVLINRSCGVTADAFMRYAGIETPVCGDMGFYLNASRLAPVVGVKKAVAAFRRHGAQNSSPAFNPLFAQGICEWEIFIRGEWDGGRLSRDQALAAIDKLAAAYANWGREHGEIAIMAPGLAALRPRVAAGETGVLDAAFRETWDRFAAAVRARKAAATP
jgi:glycosyltransferase involved in cell wall biosynthesis